MARKLGKFIEILMAYEAAGHDVGAYGSYLRNIEYLVYFVFNSKAAASKK